MKRVSITRLIAEVAIFAAIGFVLDEIQGAYSISFVNGGSIGIAMVPVLLVSYRRGWLPAILTGLIIGLFDFATKAYIYHPAQVLLDYIFPYALVGVAGFFKPLFDKSVDRHTKAMWLIIGSTIGGLAKFTSHFLSGVIFFADAAGFAWNLNYMHPVLYSFIYNIAYIGPSTLISTILLVLLFKKVNQLIMTEGQSILVKENEEKFNKKNEIGVSSVEIFVGAFIFVYFLIEYINSYTWKVKPDYFKFSFSADCMIIFILGFFLLTLGIYQLVTVYANRFKYRISCLVSGSLILIFSLYGLARIIDMHLDEYKEIENLYWAWFIPSLVIGSLLIACYFILRKKDKQKEIISAN